MAEFKEEEHPRKKDGKFAPKGKCESKQDRIKELENKFNSEQESYSISSGAKSGALNPNGKDFKRATKHAELMYETFRNIKTDIPKISKITGIEEKEIEEIKNYLFNNDEFLPEFDQAQSWDRLWKGNPIQADYTFVKHEQVEIALRKQGLSYEEAHNKANEKYNYQKEIGEYYNALFKKKRDNKK